MKILNNKRAAESWFADTMPFLILFVIAVGAIVFLLVLIAGLFISRNLEIPENVEELIIMERFYNSPECFAYQDETGRIYQKSIDLGKFKNKDIMTKCISSTNSKYAFKLELENFEGHAKDSTTTSNWARNANFKLEQKYVFVYFDNKVKSSKLSIFIQNV